MVLLLLEEERGFPRKLRQGHSRQRQQNVRRPETAGMFGECQEAQCVSLGKRRRGKGRGQSMQGLETWQKFLDSVLKVRGKSFK